MKLDWIARHERAMRRVNHAIFSLQLKPVAPRTRDRGLAPLLAYRLQLEQDLVARQWSRAIPAIDFLDMIGCTSEEAAAALGTSERRVLRWRQRADVPRKRHLKACEELVGIAEQSRVLGKVLAALHRYPEDYVLRRWYGQRHVLLDGRTPRDLLVARDPATASWVVRVTQQVLLGGTPQADVLHDSASCSRALGGGVCPRLWSASSASACYGPK